ncbi:zf-HC2 domain-containing protein [Corallococcus sp. bb12-1]|uniref:anti-sigma factor family protein n=1 Tax=Corallococcus sp. bb12-1 TaxID=2996784 RepID=UPI0022712EF4|nr:zf-HC2 domain-containing protein [Corallococcus sp. bb12-1]MCY1044065.1 zf-HC2 domain-containing protein [Corallococcus sp. bb12-1]
MSCTHEEDLTAYIDGELPPPHRARMEAHLGTCAECQQTERLLRVTVARMAELPAFTPSPSSRREVLARLDALPPTWRERMASLLRPGVLVPSAGVAATAVLALLVAGRASVDGAALEELDAGALEVATNLELVEDYEVLGLDSSDDLEVVENLHELGMP